MRIVMNKPQTRTYEFGNYCVDTAKRLLIKDESLFVVLIFLPITFDLRFLSLYIIKATARTKSSQKTLELILEFLR